MNEWMILPNTTNECVCQLSKAKSGRTYIYVCDNVYNQVLELETSNLSFKNMLIDLLRKKTRERGVEHKRKRKP